MRKRFVAAVGVLMVTAAFGAPAAMGASEFGDTCLGNDAAGTSVTVFEVSGPSPLPLAAPSSGVITKWKSNLIPVPTGIPQTLKVLRLDSSAKTALVTGEDSRTIVGGANSFDVRLPVQAGDRIGLFGISDIGTLLCEDGIDRVLGAFEGGSAVGSSVPFIEVATDVGVPVAAVIEPDVDGDGYGDETQDLCPQSATTQAACPVIVLDAFAIAGKGSATVLLSSSTEAPISVSGTVALPKGKASSSAKATLKKVTKIVKPGKLGKFKLKFPGKLKSAIAALPPGKSLTLKITASAKNVAGAVSKDKTKLKLKAAG
jgi:hypothetical protein